MRRALALAASVRMRTSPNPWVGALVITADGRSEEIGPLDSVHLPKGTVRRVDNRSARTATLLVIIANPVASPVADPVADPQDQPA